MNPETFGPHRAQGLIDAYKQKYWQCQDPRNANVIFLGLDANWDEHIESNSVMYPELLNYLDDGVKYWKAHGIHHPFLSPSYNKQGGYTYHNNFRKTGITSDYADQVSFVEILAVPTYGRSSYANKLFMHLIDLHYLKNLNDIIFNTTPKIVFIAKSVYDKLRQIRKKSTMTNFFNFDMDLPTGIDYGNRLMNIHSRNNVFVFVHTHFSGNISNNHVRNIGNVSMSFMDEIKRKHWWEIKYTFNHRADSNKNVRYLQARDVQEVIGIISTKLSSSNIKDYIENLEFKIVQDQEVLSTSVW